MQFGQSIRKIFLLYIKSYYRIFANTAGSYTNILALDYGQTLIRLIPTFPCLVPSTFGLQYISFPINSLTVISFKNARMTRVRYTFGGASYLLAGGNWLVRRFPLLRLACSPGESFEWAWVLRITTVMFYASVLIDSRISRAEFLPRECTCSLFSPNGFPLCSYTVMVGRFDSSSSGSPAPVFLADGRVQVISKVFDAVSAWYGFYMAFGCGYDLVTGFQVLVRP